MNIDLTKYLKNKDVTITNEDFDLDKLNKDITASATKGYIKEDDHKKALQEKDTEWTGKYSSLESNYNKTVKQLDDTNTKLSRTSLEKVMVLKGFKEDKFDEIAKLRSSLYAEEKDDVKAVEGIAERFKGTYFGETTPAKPKVPNEPGLNGGAKTGMNTGGKDDIKIDRNTPISNLYKTK